jgi:P27 family predicted phage terminase small subunit
MGLYEAGVSRRGPAPRPALAVLREGNPGHRPVKETLVWPPSALREPDWDDLLPGPRAEQERVRATAAELWRRVAPALVGAAGLVGEQQEVLVDYCVVYSRIVQGERALSREGIVVITERGRVKNPWTTIVGQYRSHFRSLIGELGLSPSAATRSTRPPEDDEDDPFD